MPCQDAGRVPASTARTMVRVSLGGPFPQGVPAPGTLLGPARLLQPRVECVAQAVSEEVEAERGHEDGDAGEAGQPRIGLDEAHAAADEPGVDRDAHDGDGGDQRNMEMTNRLVGGIMQPGPVERRGRPAARAATGRRGNARSPRPGGQRMVEPTCSRANSPAPTNPPCTRSGGRPREGHVLCELKTPLRVEEVETHPPVK